MKNSIPVAPKQWMDLLVLSIVVISIVAIALLMLDIFNPKIAVLIGLAIAIPIFSSLSRHLGAITNINGIGFPIIATIVLIALLFRVEPYPWINGGQDQGVYVSMSSHYQHGGNVFITDNVLAKLADTDLKDAHIENIRNSGGFFQPGVHFGGEKDYVFQFYHLHPLWMSIFADFFGDDARGYALTFFSILSILFLCLLTFELSGSKLAAISFGLLIALNPLHAFFSKWPVTEVVALAFSSMGFYYLARAYALSAMRNVSRVALLIGCLSLSLLFFVRISGFFYLPLLVLLFMIGGWQYKSKQNRFGVDLMLFSLICISLYVLSVFYGLKYSPNYSVDIYGLTFGKIWGGQWALVMTIGLLAMLGMMYAWFRALDYPSFISRISPIAHPRSLILAVFFFLMLTLGLSIFKIYQIGFSDAYNNDPWLGIRWELSGTGFAAVVRSSVINWILYTSPMLIIVGGLAMFRTKIDIRLALVFVVFAVPLGVFALSNPVLPYQYYYARYLVSESVPYAIMAFIVAMFSVDSQRWRKFAVIAVMTTIPLFAFFTFKQFGAEEGVRPLGTLRKIVAHVDENDILLIEPAGWLIPRQGVETPLKFYFGLNTFVLSTEARNLHNSKISKAFRNVWLLSPALIYDESFTLKERIIHYDKVIERSGNIPRKMIDDFWHQELFLYVMKKPGYPSASGEMMLFGADEYNLSTGLVAARAILGDGWHGPESTHIWSAGAAEFNLKKSMFPSREWPDVMKLDVEPYAASIDRPVKIKVEVGLKRYNFNYTASARNTIEFPLACKTDSEQCKVKFAVKGATTPQQLGQSSDTRVLGFALYAFTFEGLAK